MASEIKREFDKAYSERGDTFNEGNPYEAALWAAQWAMEKCATNCERMAKGLDNEWNRNIGKADDLSSTAQDCADDIRDMSKDLSG